MKIQLDTDNKTIRLESDVLLSKLITTLNSLLPNKEWKKYMLQTNTTINNWSSPIVIKERYVPSYPWYEKPYAIWCSTTEKSLGSQGITGSTIKADYKMNAGVYNLDIKA